MLGGMSRARARLPLILALGAIALVSLPPSGPARARAIDLCLLCGQNGGASALLNVVLYLPLGAALWWRVGRLRLAVAVGIAVSLGIELLQLGIPGRHTALSDLVANALGVLAGGLLAIRPASWLLPIGRTGRLLALTVTASGCGLMVAAGVLFQPSAPPGPYFGQWRPGSGSGWRYDGRVLDARIGDLPLPDATIEDADAVRRRLRARDPVQVRWIAGTAMRPLTAVFRLVAGPFDASTEVLQVGIDGDALVLTPRFRADDARAARPEVQLERALQHVAPGDTVTVLLRPLARQGFAVSVDGRRPTHLGFTVGRSWSLFYATFWRSAARLRAMDVAWFGGIAAVTGWFALTPSGAAGALAALVATAAGVPLWTGLLPTTHWEYAALLIGVVLGVALRRAAARALAAATQRREGAQIS